MVLKGGKPVLASTTIGSALHQATPQNLINVLDFGMDPKTSADQPDSQDPFYGVSLTGPGKPEYEKEAVGEGDFSQAVLDGVRVLGRDSDRSSDAQAHGRRDGTIEHNCRGILNGAENEKRRHECRRGMPEGPLHEEV